VYQAAAVRRDVAVCVKRCLPRKAGRRLGPDAGAVRWASVHSVVAWLRFAAGSTSCSWGPVAGRWRRHALSEIERDNTIDIGVRADEQRRATSPKCSTNSSHARGNCARRGSPTRSSSSVCGRRGSLVFRRQYWFIEAGAPHSSAVWQEAHSVLGDMSRTGRSQREQGLSTLWRWTYSKKACSIGRSISQKPKLSS
jgi:hypothetical protein